MHLHEEKRVYTGAPDEMVCECLQVERQEIETAIAEIDARTVAAVRRECAAGGGCGSCHEEIARLILGRAFAEPLEFSSHDHHDAPAQFRRAADFRAEIEKLLAETINPRLAALSVRAEITELGEDIVLELAGADTELKYTLSFWLDAEFQRRIHTDLTVVIA